MLSATHTLRERPYRSSIFLGNLLKVDFPIIFLGIVLGGHVLLSFCWDRVRNTED